MFLFGVELLQTGISYLAVPKGILKDSSPAGHAFMVIEDTLATVFQLQ